MCIRDREKDENPFLGYRAIRFCLDRKEDIYKPQLRALLRASAFGNIRIMVPLVTCIEEYREARGLVEELKTELDEMCIRDRIYTLGLMGRFKTLLA